MLLADPKDTDFIPLPVIRKQKQQKNLCLKNPTSDPEKNKEKEDSPVRAAAFHTVEQEGGQVWSFN